MVCLWSKPPTAEPARAVVRRYALHRAQNRYTVFRIMLQSAMRLGGIVIAL